MNSRQVRAFITASALVATIALVSFFNLHGRQSDASAAKPAPTAGPSAGGFLPLPPGGRRLEGVGVDVVPSGLTPRLTFADAVAAFEWNGPPSRSDPPHGELVTATNGDWGFPGGLYQNSFTNRLAWLITYPNATMDLHGPSMTADQRANIIASSTCSNIGLVDATSGEPMLDLQVCS